MLCGLLVGSLLGLGAGCGYAHVQDQRMLERMRSEDPNAQVCGLIVFAEAAVGLVSAVPGALLGAAVGAAYKRRSMGNNASEGPSESGAAVDRPHD
jgi:hypothetical protein